MREMILKINKNGGKQDESARFPYMEVLSIMEIA